MAKRIALPDIFQHDEVIRLKSPLLAGIDEAGRGPLAGPVVAAAVVLPPSIIINGLKDSKQTTENERIRLFWEIISCALDVGVGIVTADIIDKINILNAAKQAMADAVKDLTLKPDILMIDAVRLPDMGIAQSSIIKGESISASIAAASIVAKVTRDDIMSDYHEKYPRYAFREHKGYCTKKHVELLRMHGPCPIHRKSFQVPVAGLPFI
jgi:ribonuclease HII